MATFTVITNGHDSFQISAPSIHEGVKAVLNDPRTRPSATVWHDSTLVGVITSGVPDADSILVRGRGPKPSGINYVQNVKGDKIGRRFVLTFIYLD